MKRRGMLVMMLLALWILPSATTSAESGLAVLVGTSEDSSITGEVVLSDTPQGLRITATVSGALPGTHGFHIHEFGSCADGGKAAGGHFNPDGVQHGNLLTDGLSNTHAGDFGNLEVGEDGRGSFNGLYAGLSLSQGRYAVAGRAFILHAKADDLSSQPTGNAGDRIACGTIMITGLSQPLTR